MSKVKRARRRLGKVMNQVIKQMAQDVREAKMKSKPIEEALNTNTSSPTPGSAQEMVDKRYEIPTMKDEVEDAGPKFTQWQEHGRGLMPSMETRPVLPAGAYTLEIAPDGYAIFVPKKIETDNLLRLPDSVSDEVISDVEHFWKMEDEYKKMGYVYKRGFMLFGPPGSGKTSTLEFIAAQLVKDGGVVFIPHVNYGVAAAMLRDFRKVEPTRRCVVITEDLDAVIENQGESEVLSLFDGESSISHVLFIATTNYIDKLPPRLVNRPSRFDRRMNISMPSPEARRVYLKHRPISVNGKQLSEADLDCWVKETEGFSIAHLKEIIISVCLFGMTLKDAVQRMKDMQVVPKTEEGLEIRSVGFE